MTEFSRIAFVGMLVLLVTACGHEPSVPSELDAVARNVAMPAQAVIGDTEVTASVVPSLQLGAAAARYRIEPARDRVLVLVAARRGDADVPVQVTGHARDLRGVRQTLQFDRLDLDGRIEHVAVVRASGPDTLRLELEVTGDDGERTSLRFNRDLPR